MIEQMGAPGELYDNPQTTFVANFLGQSNLIEGTVRGRDGDFVEGRHAGHRRLDPADRSHVSGTDGELGWVGIRPEKVLIAEVGESLDAPGNSIPGGVVSDVSFVGVSTQYLVRMPWGQELQVFEQNTGRRRLFRQGEQVDISWRPEYAFLLDHNQDATAGSTRRTRSRERRPRPLAATTGPAPPRHRVEHSPQRRLTGYWLLLPGMLWLVVFFVLPLYSLVATSLYDPNGSVLQGYDMTWALQQLLARPAGLLVSRCSGRCVYGAVATVDLSRARLRAGLRHRLQVGSLEEPDAGAGDRAVLHQLPGAHAVVEAAAARRRLHREHPAVPAHRRAPTGGCSRRRSRSSPASSTTSCRSWCCRCSPASTRSTTA